jgi:hypothetical protein
MHPTAPARALHQGTMMVFAAFDGLESALAPLRDGAARETHRPAAEPSAFGRI